MPDPRTLLIACVCAAGLVGIHPVTAGAVEGEMVHVQRDVDAALAAMGLNRPGRATWTDRSIEGDRVVFTGFARDHDGGQLSAERLILTGLRMQDGGPIFDSARLENGTSRSDGADGEFQFETLTLRQPNQAIGEGFLDAFLEASDDDMDVTAGIGFQALEMTGLSAASEEEGAAYAMTLDRFVLDGFDGERLDALELSGLEILGSDAENGTVTVALASAQITGLVVDEQTSPSGFTRLASGGFKPNQAYDNASLTGLRIEGSGVLISMPFAELDGSTTSDNGFRAEVSIPSLVIDFADELPPELAFGAARLEQAGIEYLDFSLSGTFEIEGESDRFFTTEDLEFSAANLARFSLGFDMTGMMEYNEALETWEGQSGSKPGSTGAPEPQVPTEITDLLSLNAMRIEVQDLGLLELAFELMAEEQGITSDQMRAQAGFMIGMLTMGAAKDLPGDLIGDLQAALLGFVADGGTLSLSMNPPAPLSLTELESGSAGADPDQLGLSVRHSAP